MLDDRIAPDIESTGIEYITIFNSRLRSTYYDSGPTKYAVFNQKIIIFDLLRLQLGQNRNLREKLARRLGDIRF